MIHNNNKKSLEMCKNTDATTVAPPAPDHHFRNFDLITSLSLSLIQSRQT